MEADAPLPFPSAPHRGQLAKPRADRPAERPAFSITTATKCDERGRDRRCERCREAAVGKVHQRTVFSEDAVHKMQFSGDAS